MKLLTATNFDEPVIVLQYGLWDVIAGSEYIYKRDAGYAVENGDELMNKPYTDRIQNERIFTFDQLQPLVDMNAYADNYSPLTAEYENARTKLQALVEDQRKRLRMYNAPSGYGIVVAKYQQLSSDGSEYSLKFDYQFARTRPIIGRTTENNGVYSVVIDTLDLD